IAVLDFYLGPLLIAEVRSGDPSPELFEGAAPRDHVVELDEPGFRKGTEMVGNLTERIFEFLFRFWFWLEPLLDEPRWADHFFVAGGQDLHGEPVLEHTESRRLRNLHRCAVHRKSS